MINQNIFKQAKELMGDQFPRMIGYFIEDTNKYMNEIKSGLNTKNYDIILRPVHTIKSSAKQLGGDLVSNIAEKMEMLCRDINNNHFAQLEELYIQLQSATDLLFNELKTSQ